MLRHLCIQDYGKVGSMRLKAIHPDAKADLCDFHIPVMLFTFFMNAFFFGSFWIIYFHIFSSIFPIVVGSALRFAAEF